MSGHDLNLLFLADGLRERGLPPTDWWRDARRSTYLWRVGEVGEDRYVEASCESSSTLVVLVARSGRKVEATVSDVVPAMVLWIAGRLDAVRLGTFGKD